jgi:hypothetical protein
MIIHLGLLQTRDLKLKPGLFQRQVNIRHPFMFRGVRHQSFMGDSSYWLRREQLAQAPQPAITLQKHSEKKIG